MEKTNTIQETQGKLKVVEDSILGTPQEGFNLYLILWERIANHGLIYCWAACEEDAYRRFSFQLNKAVRHTIIKLDVACMPVTDNRRKA